MHRFQCIPWTSNHWKGKSKKINSMEECRALFLQLSVRTCILPLLINVSTFGNISICIVIIYQEHGIQRATDERSTYKKILDLTYFHFQAIILWQFDGFVIATGRVSVDNLLVKFFISGCGFMSKALRYSWRQARLGLHLLTPFLNVPTQWC